MEKTPAVAYYTRKVRTTNRLILINEIDEAPLTKKDRYFLYDIIEGLSYKELAEKYCISMSRVYQIKRELFERMTMYDRQKA